MAHPLRAKASVVGVGTTATWDNPGFSAMDQMGLAVAAAAADAGLSVRDIDGLFFASLGHLMPALTATEYLGLRPKVIGGTNIGGASFMEHLLSAVQALDAGLCDTVCICYGSNQRSAGGKLLNISEPAIWEAPYHPRTPVSQYALAAQRHMHQFGTTREHLAEVAVAARAWARLNPAAFSRGPLSIADVLSARMLSDPLTQLDCCLVTDGGGALILQRREQATDRPQPPVHVLGVGVAASHRFISSMPDLTVTSAVESGQRAYAMAGIGSAEVDVIQLYDAFTINTILFLEDLGFCPKGEGGRFVEGGAIAPGGALKVNTNGGGLSCCHPGMYGVFAMIEAVVQLRGTAGDRQAKGANIALAHGNGGVLSGQATAIFGSVGTA